MNGFMFDVLFTFDAEFINRSASVAIADDSNNFYRYFIQSCLRRTLHT